ncbi:MAG TPA: c-type cytochrome [Gammaproteobacteria bacterium]|nr:c-type cytochrome [Gammaproteobacteria bacterium]
MQAAETQQQRDVQLLLHVLDYIGVDYPGTVLNGVVKNAAEYAEQQEFSQQMGAVLERFPDNAKSEHLRKQIEAIQQAIAARVSGKKVTSLCREASALIIATYQVIVAPKRVPSLQVGRQLYQAECVRCHGVNGQGDGPNAAGLEPPPANFHDRERQSQRSIYSLYATLSLGVNGTAMPAFSQYSSAQRWALAFYVGQYFATDAERQKGEQLWQQRDDESNMSAISNLKQLGLLSPEDAKELAGEDGVALLAYLRSNPALVMPKIKDALEISRQKLAASLDAYRLGQTKQAYELAMSAYLDGFELTEGQLKTLAPELRKQVELNMAGYRQLIQSSQPVASLQSRYQSILAQLDEVKNVLSTAGESASVTFIGSMLILLREGVEAILVLAAIAAFLAKSDRSHHLNYVHIGWISALLLGVATWVVAQHYIDISGANREMTEGVAALVASVMLLYVGFWMHRQSNAIQWKKFLYRKLDAQAGEVGQVKKSALWSLVFIAFLAVYREVLETVLFYQAFWYQSSVSGHRYIIMGFVAAAVLLVGISWALFRFSVRLPLRPFFLTNAVLLFVLSLVYIGKGIIALQEAGVLQKNTVNFIEIDLLGVYPNLESLGLQAFVLFLAALWLLRLRYKTSQ